MMGSELFFIFGGIFPKNLGRNDIQPSQKTERLIIGWKASAY
jgi:hypothetical protein